MKTRALRTELKSRMGRRTDLDDDYIAWINRAYYHITTRYKFRELDKTYNMSTAVGKRKYKVKDGFQVVRSLYDKTNDRWLTKRDWQSIERVKIVNGKPSRWARYGSVLMIDPAPDAVYTVRANVKIRVDALVNDATDAPLTPESWDEAILLKAQSIGMLNILERGASVDYNTLYQQWIRENVEIEVVEEADDVETLYVRT